MTRISEYKFGNVFFSHSCWMVNVQTQAWVADFSCSWSLMCDAGLLALEYNSMSIVFVHHREVCSATVWLCSLCVALVQIGFLFYIPIFKCSPDFPNRATAAYSPHRPPTMPRGEFFQKEIYHYEDENFTKNIIQTLQLIFLWYTF